MANPVEQKQIEEQIKAEEANLDSWFYKFFYCSIAILIAVSVTLIISYLWNIPAFEFDSSIAADRWGQFGDFFGGVVGTIVTLGSIVFVYKAFKEQRIANIEAHSANAEMIRQSEVMKKQDDIRLYLEKLQQFEVNYNRLIELYNESIKSYKSDSLESGKHNMSNMVASYISNTTFANAEAYIKKVKTATAKFNAFITAHRTTVNTHMRLLYQLLMLLQDSDLNDRDKIVYVKTLRAQLCDEELVLIRYNCMTNRGEKMQMPVFYYNILKHLPMLDLFEFKKYRKGLSNTQINLLNGELIYWRKSIRSLFSKQSMSDKTMVIRQYGDRYDLNISIDANNTHYTLKLLKKPRTRGRNYDPMITVLDRFEMADLKALLIDFHNEIFRISHFRQYNEQREFRISSDTENLQLGEFAIIIRAISNHLIIVSFSQIEDPMSNE